MAENNNFILYCDLPDKTANDYPTGTFSPRNLPKQSSCTMITDNGGNDQITVGVLVDANSEADDVLAHANAVIAGTSNDLNSIFVKTASCTKSGDSQFLKCYGRGSILDDKEPHVYAYYNNVTKYVLFSTERINAIDATFLETIWGTIRDFFRNLFLGKPPAYNYITQTSSFDKIYILKNGALTVTGVEELKYDEADSELRTLLYLNYPSTNQANNPIDLQYISKIGNYSISSNPNYLEIIIKSTDTTGLFRYLTATLRTR
jgi:hypothetical protein